MSKLDGRVAVVTGAGRGIGRAIARKLAAEGARLVINDRDEALCAEVARELGDAHVVAGDVTAADFGDRLIQQTVDAHGALDILVNNAGYAWTSAVINAPDEQWYAMIDVHATAPFRILRAAGKYFRDTAKGRGDAPLRKVVNISSLAGSDGAGLLSSYSAAKGAVISLTRAVAKEWGRYGVTVNCVAFGLIETRLSAAAEATTTSDVDGITVSLGIERNMRQAMVSMTPLGRVGTPEEAAGAVYLLSIPESDFVTGQLLVCSGGLRM